MLLAEASSAICVQRFDGSRISAIHTTYRISLRSSSLREPRYPLLRVVLVNEASALSLMLRISLDEFGLVLVGWIREPTQARKPRPARIRIAAASGGIGPESPTGQTINGSRIGCGL
jgi:hypothetical protein